jgi:hypothetical protein
LGHNVDNTLTGGIGLWSEKHFVQDQYKNLGNGKNKYLGNREDAPYSTDSPRKDFADTFAWIIVKQNPSVSPGGWDPTGVHSADAERMDQLADAIASLNETEPKPSPIPTQPEPTSTPTQTPHR